MDIVKMASMDIGAARSDELEKEDILKPAFGDVRQAVLLISDQTLYRARLKDGSKVARMLQARPGRRGKQQQ